MIRCPSCGVENLDAARFCMNCTAPLAAAAPLAEERKVVTTLICDLVSFTALSEAADPEDVDALLRTYCGVARQAIESHGGTVEKFIGDAVVGVFGVPAVHEDDPERAVRAGLRIVEAMAGMVRPDGSPLQARVGVNTGEALVRLDVTPGSGEGFLTGDAVNTAARLQTAAPPGGVAVGEATWALTQRAFAYEELEPVSAKGKSQPLAVWLALSPLARTGAGRLDAATPFVGRRVELAYLTALLDKAVESAQPQFALIVGEPGIGKSRLLAELYAHVDAGERLVTWRQGACLPYGEGVTFWVLAEIVKAHAGILETDDRQTVEARLDAVLPQGEDREWFRQRLRALLGMEAPQAGREENFTAWLRFLEEIAASGPTVVVLEDLHSADEALLAFLEYFASHVAEVPLFLLATTRPELFETHPTFAASGRVNRVVLAPLSENETETLVASLLEELAGEVRATIARHSEGNPFYAEESARLVRDTVRGDQTERPAAVAATVQAVIAARLDALPPEQKAALTDASVVGQVFWDGAVAALSGRSAEEVDGTLRELVAKQLVHRVRSSSMAGEDEFSFGHALAREVAYGELPRAVRARKHAAAAAWVEAKAGERAEDLAEVLAHHYATALDLARTLGDGELAASLLAPTIRHLGHAGDRALRLDAAAAEPYFARALELAGTDTSERLRLLPRWAQALFLRNRYREAAAAYEEAIADLQACGDIRAAAAAMTCLATVRQTLGEPYGDLKRAAVDLLADDEPSAEQADVFAVYAGLLLIEEGDYQSALAAATRAIEISEQLALPEPAMAMSRLGAARRELGDLGGLEDYERALAAARAQGLGAERAVIEFNYGFQVFMTKGARAALNVYKEGLEFTRRHGIETYELAYRGGLVWGLCNVGDWDRALAEAGDLVATLEAAEDIFDLLMVRAQRALILAWRGEPLEAAPLVAWLAEKGREIEIRWLGACALLAASAVRLRLGEPEAALALLNECVPRMDAMGSEDEEVFPEALRIALACGDAQLAGHLMETVESLAARESFPLHRYVLATVRALLAESRGEHEAASAGFAAAAAGWHEFGMPYEEAQARLGQGRCLVALGKRTEAVSALAAAREIFNRLGAKPALAETDGLMNRVTADSG